MKHYKDKTKGFLHSVETMGLVDGPGIRTIFFLQGCPLRCRYCHNPDTQEMFQGREITPTEILQLAKRYKAYQGEEGGVTFSGGEPLVQGEFLVESLKLLKENGFSTCVDTSGYGQKEFFPEIFPYVDTVMLDIKAFSDKDYHDMCFVSQKPLLDFMSNLEDYGFAGQIWIRHVMVPGYTDNQKAMQELVETIKPIQHMIERLEILPYHTAGVQKYKELDRPYLLEDVPAMDIDKAKEFEIYANQLLSMQMQKNRKQKNPKKFKLNKSIAKNNKTQEKTCADSQTIDDFAKLPLLNKIPAGIFEDIKSKLKIMHLKKDDFLFKSGDQADFMYIIHTGAIKIFTLLPDNKEQILYIYQEDAFVGGHNLLEKSAYWYTGQAMLDSTIIAIPAKIFDVYFKDRKSILKEILSQSFERIRWAEDLINRLSTLNYSVKTAGLILRLAESIGQEVDGQIQVPLEFDESELGNFSGLGRQALARKLGEFESLGYIDIENDVLTILNLNAIESYLE